MLLRYRLILRFILIVMRISLQYIIVLFTDSKHSTTLVGTHKTSLVSLKETKPPEIVINTVTQQMKHVFPNVTSIIRTSPQFVTSSTSNVHGHVEAELSFQYHGTTAQTVTLQNIKSQHSNLTSTHSISSRYCILHFNFVLCRWIHFTQFIFT